MMKNVCCLLLLAGLVYACTPEECREKQFLGAKAKSLIRKFDPVFPNTMVNVPDSLLLSSSRAVEQLLDSMAAANILSWSMRDTTAPYKYYLLWNKSLDHYRKDTLLPADTVTWNLAGHPVNARLQYKRRMYAGGNIAWSPEDSLYFRHTCTWVQYKYAYYFDTVNTLGRFAGHREKKLMQRLASFPLSKPLSWWREF